MPAMFDVGAMVAMHLCRARPCQQSCLRQCLHIVTRRAVLCEAMLWSCSIRACRVHVNGTDCAQVPELAVQ
eukprot:6939533-Lingulodinium_polyedra.AAC.1